VVVAGLFRFQKPVTAGRVMSDFVSAFFFVKLESVRQILSTTENSESNPNAISQARLEINYHGVG
jgi:hypothetical protein